MSHPNVTTSATSGERCPRCKQVVTVQSARCENCGQPLTGQRNLTMLIGIGGVFAVIFVVLLMWVVVRNDDLVKAPPPPDEAAEANAPVVGERPKLQELSSDADKKQTSKPEKPP